MLTFKNGSTIDSVAKSKKTTRGKGFHYVDIDILIKNDAIKEISRCTKDEDELPRSK